MRRRVWTLVAAVVLLAAATGGVLATTGRRTPTAAAQVSSVHSAPVERGRLSALVSLDGILTRRGRADGSAYTAINRARGTFTMLPEGGDKVRCGDVLYRVDDRPVLLLCGTVPAWRDLRAGDAGRDVRQLNRNLHRLGSDDAAHVAVDPHSRVFTEETEKALEKLQTDRGAEVTGRLGAGAAVFLPGPVRIATVAGVLGGPARPGQQVGQATSDTLEVHLALDPSQQGEVKQGDRARITLPGDVSVTGRVGGFGRIAQAPSGSTGKPAGATVPAYVSLDRPALARGLDRAPVQVDITTKGVDDALSVPVTAIVGRSGGGFAVEAVREGGRRELVGVSLGLFDTTAGRVQVDGDLHEGDHVVVPAP